MRRPLMTLCVALMLISGCKQRSSRMQIAVIPKGTTHEFWKAVDAGAQQAGKDLDVDILWKGPLKEDDRSAQIDVVQQFVGDKVAGIVLAPLDRQALLSPVQLANSQKVPVVIIDSSLDGEAGRDFVSFVATDNEKGGQMAGEELARLLDNKGKVVLMRYQAGSASTEAREKGFLDAIHKHPDINVISDNQESGATVDSAKAKAMNMVDQLKECDGLFCPNESSTVGMLSALQTAGISGKKFVGFDASPQMVDALKNKELDALVVQNPYQMGYLGVKTMVEHIRGQSVQQRIDTGVQLVTRDNLNTPESQKLLESH
jgi:ribose transport system substrate-binding protein